MPETSDPPAGAEQKIAAVPQVPIPDVLKELTPEQTEGLITVIAQVTAQMTTGPYPPPAMMAEYARIDPAINVHILNEARTQADHRRSLERLSTERTQGRLDRAPKIQRSVAYACLLAAIAIIAIPLWITNSVPFGAALVAALIGVVGVGGQPAATIATSYIARRLGRPSAPASPSPGSKPAQGETAT